MHDTETLYLSSLEKLNGEQREAVETLDGPLLVVAGPGTGKTQLLSTRAAHILHERDVSPKNLLCLTFTEAGARAMSQRLISIIGKAAYEIEVSTFHAFAQRLHTHYPDFFNRSPMDTLISDLHKSEIVNDLLNGLSVNAAGHFGKRDGMNSSLSEAMKFIDDFKKTGLSVNQGRAIVQQTLDFMDLAEADPVIAQFAREGIAGAKSNEKKLQIFEGFAEAVGKVHTQAPSNLKEQLVSTPGVYVPYATYFADLVNNFDVYSDKNSATGINEKGNATGVSQFRSAHFNKDSPDGHLFKDYKKAQRALDMLDVYERYMETMHKEGLYDFDDIINDAIAAIEGSAELQTELSMRYEYIQVDEFQDTNGAQMRLLQLTAGGKANPNVMAVGDDDQAIMRFQGATIECIKQFKALWNPKEVFLTTNYRSAPNIIELGQRVASQIENRLPGSGELKNIHAASGRMDAQDSFEELAFPSEESEYNYVAERLKEIMESAEYREGLESGSIEPESAIGIIAPKHACLQALIPYLEAADISYSYKVNLNVLNIESMQTLLCAMRFASLLSGGHKKAALAQLPQLIAAPEFGLSHAQVVDFMIDARAYHAGDWFAALRDSGSGKLAKLDKRLEEWAALAPSAPVRQLILDMAQASLEYYGASSSEDPWSLIELNAGIRALMRFVEEDVSNHAGGLRRALRLSDVVERIDMLSTFGIDVNANIEIGDVSTVRLTTIHSSKGLEYKWVFLLDAEDEKWHYNGGASWYVTPNIYISAEKDEDDHRRALFVAVTRAKDYLYMCRSTGKQIRELSGIVASLEANVPEDDLAEIIQTGWTDCYALDEPRFVNRVVAEVNVDNISASRLNRFVTYAGNEQGFADFLLNSLMRIPQPPFIGSEFGTLVHVYLNMYVSDFINGSADEAALEQMAQQVAEKISLLDFPEDEISAHLEKFQNILNDFVPTFDPFKRAMEGKTRLLTEVALNAVTEGGVPLYGLIDLMEIDDANRRIMIHDYKTGKYNRNKQVNYDRQLLFYRLLVQASGEYEGYEVVDCVDHYIEHVKDATKKCLSSYRLEAEDMAAEEMHLERLIGAVWKRIKSGNYDNSAFEDSLQRKEADKSCFRADGAFKNGGRARFQRLYEEWLIETS